MKWASIPTDIRRPGDVRKIRERIGNVDKYTTVSYNLSNFALVPFASRVSLNHGYILPMILYSPRVCLGVRKCVWVCVGMCVCAGMQGCVWVCAGARSVKGVHKCALVCAGVCKSVWMSASVCVG